MQRKCLLHAADWQLGRYALGAMYGWDLPLPRWAYALTRERGVGTEVALLRRG